PFAGEKFKSGLMFGDRFPDAAVLATPFVGMDQDHSLERLHRRLRLSIFKRSSPFLFLDPWDAASPAISVECVRRRSKKKNVLRNLFVNFRADPLTPSPWELWFQQDGATCHTARATIDLLKDTFGDRLISRFGPVNWPPRSCDSTPLDYFLWGYVKSLVYADKPQTLDHLEDNIHRVIADIRPQMLEKVIENWTSRVEYIRARHGSHMPEIIFKM
ncbi:uncharacterized protein TNCV_4183441, partial [Trichonephila clavipes]